MPKRGKGSEFLISELFTPHTCGGLKTATQNSMSRTNERNWNDWSVFMHVNKSICAGHSPTGDEGDLPGIAIATDQVFENAEEVEG